jgi:hypothetical protein
VARLDRHEEGVAQEEESGRQEDVMRALGLLLCLALGACSRSKEEPTGREIAVKLELSGDRQALDLDARVLRGLVRSPPPATGAEAWAKSLAAIVPESEAPGGEIHYHGFGLVTREVVMPCGYACCRVNVRALDDVIEHAEVSCAVSEKDFAELEPFYREVLGALDAAVEHVVLEGKTPQLRIYHAERKDPAVGEKHRARLAAALGARVAVGELPAELAEAHEKLTSLAVVLEVGTSCGVGGEPPVGHRLMERLVAAKRADLLRDALRGPSAEGRVYAALGLAKLGPLAAEDRASIEAILADPAVPVRSCRGCSPALSYPIDSLAELLLVPAPSSSAR